MSVDPRDVISAAVCSGAGINVCEVTISAMGVRAEFTLHRKRLANEVMIPSAGVSDVEIASMAPLFHEWARRVSDREGDDSDQPAEFATLEDLEAFLDERLEEAKGKLS